MKKILKIKWLGLSLVIAMSLGATPTTAPMATPPTGLISDNSVGHLEPEFNLESNPGLLKEFRTELHAELDRLHESLSVGSVAQSRGATRSVRKLDPRLAKARELAKAGQYLEASKLLFQLGLSPNYTAESTQIKYILGLMLFELKLNQSAAFIFFEVVRQESRKNAKSRYVKLSLEKLALAADYLNSDVLLKYAIKQIDENDFPPSGRDMLYFRMGEIKYGEQSYEEAARLFSRVRASSMFYTKARYMMGLSFAESKQFDRALSAFEDLIAASETGGVVNRNRVNALIGKARILYQQQNWDAAIEAYRQIPRDTEQWHDAVFESSWAMLRSARFRSSLSNFHTLHSAFYDDFYQPESLILRAIVYVYICRYDEMEKVLGLFEKVYKPVFRNIKRTLAISKDPVVYYRELAKMENQMNALKQDANARKAFQIPYIVAKQILKEGDVRRSFGYLRRLNEEKVRLASFPPNWVSSGIGRFSSRVLERRIQASYVLAGRQVRRHLILIQRELLDHFEQNGFLRIEMLSGKREAIKKDLAGKGLVQQQVADDKNRDYFIQNGYEYWPFSGEYWLDELGNYHFVGVQACE